MASCCYCLQRMRDRMSTAKPTASAPTAGVEYEIEHTHQLAAHSNPSPCEASRLLYFEPVSYMDPELYWQSAILVGNFDAFQDIESGSRPYCDQVTPRGNTVLHLAAAFGHNQLVQFLVDRCPGLVGKANYEGDLALHVAACGGHLPTLQSLLPATIPEGETDINCALQMINKKGNTALHIALENRHEEVAKSLFEKEKDVTVLNYRNSEGKSPLCLAVEAGYTELVKLMTAKKCVRGEKNPFLGRETVVKCVNLPLVKEPKHKKNLDEGKSLVHAAILGRNRDILEELCNADAALIELSMDEEGRTALSFAAYEGYLDGVKYLLHKSTEIAYVRDRNGYFPIHMASKKGHIEIVHEFLNRCPDSRELLVDEDCQNILHVAAMCGKAKMVTDMLKTEKLDMLINERDNRRVRLDAINDEGMTAMDVALNNMETMAPFQMILTLTALKSANAPSSEKMSRNREEEKMISTSVKSANVNIDPFKDRINILVLVSTLVATVTFAAGFTMPGGNNDSGKDEGMATMVTKPAFHAFLICDTIAMYSSIIVVISLIFAQLSDLNLILMALRVAFSFLGLAVVTMSAAFMVGTYLVVSNHNLLAIFVLILGSIFFIILLFLFILLFSPTSSHNYIARYVFYYPFCWMILVTRSDVDSKNKRTCSCCQYLSHWYKKFWA